ncbi:PqiB family protein [Vibrio astriarenae]|uniref:PqiB family protein n=1 Tax=Vibrio astriarenae TaxID=1481923 RepID=UPI0037366858
MSEGKNNSESTTTFKPNVKKNRGISPLWMLPILTMVLAGWLVFKAVHDAGQRVQIYFSDAQGLVPGRTAIRYQGLEIGMVRDINLTEDLEQIFVDADIYPQANKLLTEGARFWLVKPQASLTGVSGLDALVSGNYIAIQPGDVNAKPATQFTALDFAPADQGVSEGLNIVLKARELGGISIGSQIVYRKIPIGEVYNYRLDETSKHVIIKANINDDYAHIITDESRFWNVSGIGASIGLDGVDMRLESVSALISGAIAVDSPDGGLPVADDTEFQLYKDVKTAGRGIAIQITLPDNHNISSNGTSIFYRGIKVGQVTRVSLSENREKIVAHAAIEPVFVDMLTDNTQFILQEAKVSLSGVENLGNLVKGNFLTIEPEDGERAREFVAVRQDDFDRQLPNSLPLKLVSDDAYGLEVGTPIKYRGIKVGNVTDINLIKDSVVFDVLIEGEYSNLIRSSNRFYVAGTASVQFDEQGLNVHVPPAKQLLEGSISFLSEGSDKPSTQYSLFKSQSHSELAKFNQSGSQKLTLFADELPPISTGAPLLYRNLQVGSVVDYSLNKEGVSVTVSIENQYRYLIESDTVFWNRSGVEIDASLSGIKVTASPLKTLVNGGIAFDRIQGVTNKVGKNWKLYDSLDTAKAYGQYITLQGSHTHELNVGTKIKFGSVIVGEVTDITPNFQNDSFEFGARIYPQFASDIARGASQFYIAPVEVSLSGIRNLKSALNPQITVIPGEGPKTTSFTLQNNVIERYDYTLTLQSETRSSVQVGTPVTYREMQVGSVIGVSLGEFADRVITTITIEPEYRYLVRANSVFWNASGLDVSIGLTGAKVKAGTLDSIIKGGIAFATPQEAQLKPPAKSGYTFFLNAQAKEEWVGWRTPIPKP